MELESTNVGRTGVREMGDFVTPPTVDNRFAKGGRTMKDMRFWVSGGASGLGFHFCDELVKLGCTAIAIVDVASESFGGNVVEQLISTSNGVENGGREVQVVYFEVDVRDGKRVEESMRAAWEMFGGLDVVVNNAGVIDEEDLERTMSVNAIGAIRGTEVALKVFKELGCDAGEGERCAERTIVNMGSAGGVFGVSRGEYYAASKHAVVGYSRSVAFRTRKENVNVVCVCPAWVATGMGLTAERDGLVSESGIKLMGVQSLIRQLTHIVRHARAFHGQVIYVSEKVGACLAHPKLRKSKLLRSKL